MPNPMIHFELPADDLERARSFYTSIFGWKITDPWKMEYYLVETKDKDGNGINGGMMKRKGVGQPFTNYILVDEINDTLAKVKAGGGRIAMPKTEIGAGMGWIGAFIDTEANLIGLHQITAAMKQQVAKPASRKSAAKKAPAKKAATKKPAKKVVKKAAKKKAKRK